MNHNAAGTFLSRDDDEEEKWLLEEKSERERDVEEVESKVEND